MQISVTSNISPFLKKLTAIQRQMPFATSQAINDTAFQVRKQIVERTYPRSFEVRNRGFPKTAFRVQKSHKRNLEAHVYDRTKSDWLTRQAKGGIKRNPSGPYVAIPTSTVRLTGRGKIRQADKPRSILSKGGFQIKSGAGEAIFKTKNRVTRAYYFLRSQAVIPKRFPFAEDAARITRRNYRVNFRKRLRGALRTAR